MATQRRDPYRNFNFRVAIGGRASANDGFSALRLPTLLTRPDVAVDAESALGDEGSSHLVLRRGFTGCRPVALHYSPLDALESAVVTETIVLAFDDVDVS